MVIFVPQSLVTSLPESLSVCFFTTSGPEANDLAMRLVKRYTGESDIMVVEEAHHGNIGIMLDISPKMHPKYVGLLDILSQYSFVLQGAWVQKT